MTCTFENVFVNYTHIGKAGGVMWSSCGKVAGSYDYNNNNKVLFQDILKYTEIIERNNMIHLKDV